MSRTREDVMRFLEGRGRAFEVMEDGTLAVSVARGQVPALLRIESPVVVINVEVCSADFEDSARAAAFYRRVLEFNATSLLHASYGVEGSHLVLGAALELDNLDENELEAALSDIGLALVEHVPELFRLALGNA